MARTSAADLAHGLKGAKFPRSKKDLVSLSRKNGVADEVLQTFELQIEFVNKSLDNAVRSLQAKAIMFF